MIADWQMDTQAVASRLGISRQAVRRLLWRGKLRGHLWGAGRMWLIDGGSVAAYERERRGRKRKFVERVR